MSDTRGKKQGIAVRVWGEGVCAVLAMMVTFEKRFE